MAALQRLPALALLLWALASAAAAQAPSPGPAADCAARAPLIDLLNQSAAATNSGDSATAASLLHQLVDGASEPACAPLRGVALRRLALADSYRGDYASALASLERALPLLHDTGVPRDEAGALVQQGYALMRLRRTPEAISVLRVARDRALAIDDTPNVLFANEYIASMLPPGDDGRAFMDAGLAYARSVPGGRRSECALLHLLGDRRFTEGHYADAVPPLSDSIACYDEVKDWMALGTAYVSLGRVYRAHGRLDLALAQHEHALAVQRRLPLDEPTLQTVNAIAVTLGLMGRYSEAVARLREGLTMAGQLRSRTYEQFLKGSLAGEYLRTGRAREAAGLLEEVLDEPSPSQAATRWAQLATARLALGTLGPALDAADRGVALAGDTAVDPMTTTLGARMAVLTALHRYDDAAADLTRLLEIIEQARRSTLPADYLRRGFASRHQDVFSAAVRLLQAQNRPREALETAERARSRAFLDLLAARGPSVDGTHATALGTAASFEQMTATARRLDSTILAFWVGESATTAWIVDPAGRIASVDIPITAARLTTLVRDALRGTTEAASGLAVSPTAARRPWRALAAALIDPIRSKLPRRAGSRLTIVPHGPLFSVPFAALPSATGTYLIETYDIHYVPAVGVLAYTTAPDFDGARGTALLVGDPAPAATPEAALALPPLPWAAREVRDIDRWFGNRATLLTRADATEARVRASLSSPAVLHFATHAVVRNEQGLTSYLALADSATRDRLTAKDDGRLTADEMYGLRLNADLVVLSGCGTALGPISGEGVIGFTRAFLAAGAASVVATLWDVPDRTTFEVMRTFYQRRLGGARKSTSLRQAQLAMLAALRAGRIVVDGRPLAESPRLWAAYVLVGEP